MTVGRFLARLTAQGIVLSLLLAFPRFFALMLFYAYLLLLFGLAVVTAVTIGVLLWVELNGLITWLETRRQRT